MRKLALQLGLALALVACATASHANIFVKITDGTNTLDGGLLSSGCTPLTFPAGCMVGQFTVTQPASAIAIDPTYTQDVTVAMTLLSCSTRPCTVFFPSGQNTQQPGDTFKFQDTSSTGPFARVVMFDSASSADRISLRGLKITSLTAGKTLTVNYATQLGDLRCVTAVASNGSVGCTTTSTLYPATAAMSGTFRTALGGRATACGDGTTTTSVDNPCVKLQIKVNGTTIDGQGLTTSATASVPCNNNLSDNPCGTSGSWGSDGSFSGVNDTNSLDCPAPCTPNSRGLLTAVFNGANETLQLAASMHGAFGNRSTPNGGLEENFLTLSDEQGLGGPRWVPYAGEQRCKAVPKAPSTNNTHNSPTSTFPVSFELWCGNFVQLAPEAGKDLLSIVDASEVNLTGSEKVQNDASRVGFLPMPGQLVKGINVLSLTYDVFVGTGSSGNSTLGDVSYTDCVGGSLRLEFELLNKGAPIGTAKLYLGSSTGAPPTDDHFKSLCNGFESIIASDLVGNQDARVDTSELAGKFASPCCITFKQFQQGSSGNLTVRKMALIVDHGNQPFTTFANHKITFYDGNVNGSTALSSLQVLTEPTRTFDLSTDGVSIVITKVFDPVVPISEPKIVDVIPSSGIQINGGKFTTSVTVGDLDPHPGAQYSINLCPSSSEDAPLQDPPGNWLPRGICIPDQALVTLLP